jgi:hypothetical protein
MRLPVQIRELTTQIALCRLLWLEDFSGLDESLDFAGAFDDFEHFCVVVVAFEQVVLRVPVPA